MSVWHRITQCTHLIMRGLVWRKLKSTHGNKSYGLQLIILFENGHCRSIAWNVGTVANQNALYSVLLLCCLWIGGLAHCCVGNWGYLSGHNVHIVARITSTVYITEALIQSIIAGNLISWDPSRSPT
eukprot:1039456_1